MEARGERTEYDVGGILRRWGRDYCRSHRLRRWQLRVMEALSRCRTSALGGHTERCEDCGREHPVYNSCGDRHCPTCQGLRARKWLKRQLGDLLATPYFHCIFTIPDAFNVLVPANPRVVYDVLFKASWQALRHLTAKRLGGEPGATAVLHTWGQALWLHPHVHMIVTGGALAPDRTRWRSSGSEFLVDVFELSAEFRKRFCRLLRRAPLELTGQHNCPASREELLQLIDEQERREWVVHCKKPFAGAGTVLEYLSRYVFRVAISNRRITEVSDDGEVAFTYKDYRDTDAAGRPRDKAMSLTAMQFIQRFVQHILPPGFRKVRSFGLFAGAERQAKLGACRALLGPVETPATLAELLTPREPRQCPYCGSTHLVPGLTLHPERAPPITAAYDDGSAEHAA